jgi:nicotinamidase-related amidase
MLLSGVLRPSTGRITSAGAVFFECDLQEAFRGKICKWNTVVSTARLLMDAARIMTIPVIATEQYPERLKGTVAELPLDGVAVFSKRSFSMITEETERKLDEWPARRSAILFGIETHVCVQQTALDLLARDWDVHVVVDGVSSIRMFDRAVALHRMEKSGAYLVSAESLLFELLRTSTDPNFKAVSGLIKQHAETHNEFSHMEVI